MATLHGGLLTVRSSHAFVELMRRYVLDYLACGNTSVCESIMEADYRLFMGGHQLGPRDEVYVPAVAAQMEQFPGLCMTVNDLICNGDRLAMRFTQHGASMRHQGRTAAWGGVGLYRWNGHKLTSNWALEDYYARRRQLREQPANPVDAPHVAPWDIHIEDAQPAAEDTVRTWLDGTLYGSPNVTFDDERYAEPSGPLIDVQDTMVDDLFSAGATVAFHVTQTGTYAGGAGKPERVGEQAILRSAGIVQVVDRAVSSGHVIRDRSGLFS